MQAHPAFETGLEDPDVAAAPLALHEQSARQRKERSSGARPPYTVREAAHLLGMKETALRERIRMRRVRVLRLGRRVLVKREELERLLAEGSVEHAADGRHVLLRAPR